ncbi:MAG: T9SS type A sorting domain-containing protein, partial [Bacteroidota bacterium]
IDTSALASTWLQDSPDLFIGLYDWRGAHHAGYGHGRTPDYHMRFAENRIIVDNDGVDLLTPGTNYNFTVKQITSGYTIEARIPWTTFHSMVPADSLFAPVEGMRIPIDFEINDNDTPGDNAAREGMMCYAPLNQDNSYADVWRWTYTWIGNKMSTTGVAQQPTTPFVYALMQNYPNPFNPTTIIRYSLAKTSPVTVRVYDVLGREVVSLVNGEVQSAGPHQTTFSASQYRGGLASGVYFYKIEAGSFHDVKKMMLVK